MMLRRYESRVEILFARIVLVSGFLLHSALLSISSAQITLDGSLGPKGALPGPDHVIGAEVGQQRGANLFHSFGDFNIRQGESATFTGPKTVENVIGRVTGGTPSTIDGPLRSELPNANVYLLNPSGVLFGPNASLDVQGSFHVSTADYLKMADGAEFHADLGKGSTLSIAPPEAFGFSGTSVGKISVDGSSLTVPNGKTLSIVGGAIEMTGGADTTFDKPTLGAASGQINVASVASQGEIKLAPVELQAALKTDAFERRGDIAISRGAIVDASGDGGGTVLIRGGQFTADNANISAVTLGNRKGTGIDVQVDRASVTGGAVIVSSTIGGGQGGSLIITASDSLSISGHDNAGNPSGLFSNSFSTADSGGIALSTKTLAMDEGKVQSVAATNSTGSAGGVTVKASQVSLTGGAQIDTSTYGLGHSGPLTIAAKESVTIAGRNGAGFRSGLFSTAQKNSRAKEGAQAAHILRISAPVVQVEDGRIQTTTAGTANAGDIELDVGKLVLTQGAQIDSSTSGDGQGGRLRVNAADSLSISGEDDSGFRSGLFSNTSGNGNAGGLSVSAPVLTVEGGRLDTSGAQGNGGTLLVKVGKLTLTGGGQIDASTYGPGHGGGLTVTATESVMLTGRSRGGSRSGLFANTNGSGDAGTLFVMTPSLTVADGRIGALTVGEGNAGQVKIRVGTLHLIDGGQISGSSGVEDAQGRVIVGTGQGGTLEIVATGSVLIVGQSQDGFKSGLFSTTDGRGNAGIISLSTPTLSMNDGRIVTRTSGDGQGGDITLKVERLVLTNGAQIFSGIGNVVDGKVIGTQGPGRGGNVVITATDSVSLTGSDNDGFPSAVASSAQIGQGEAGDILISTPKIEIKDGGQILALTRSLGQGGAIRVTVGDSIAISGHSTKGFPGGVFSATSTSAQGGEVQLLAKQIVLSNGAVISAASSSTGNAGNIELRAADTFRSHNGVVTTDAQSAQGGQIAISAGRVVQITGNGQVTTSVATSTGDAGKITIASEVRRDPNDPTKFLRDPDNPRKFVTVPVDFVVLDGKILATAKDGNGGNIQIDTSRAYLQSTQSETNVSSVGGISGTIDVRAPVTSISGSFAPLPESILKLGDLLPERCDVRLRTTGESSFVVEGQDSVPPEPTDFRTSPLPE